MSYKIKKEGYEFKGFKLGDYIGSDKIIGFDYKYDRVAVLGEYTVKCVFIGDGDNLDDVSVILEGYLHNEKIKRNSLESRLLVKFIRLAFVLLMIFIIKINQT